MRLRNLLPAVAPGAAVLAAVVLIGPGVGPGPGAKPPGSCAVAYRVTDEQFAAVWLLQFAVAWLIQFVVAARLRSFTSRAEEAAPLSMACGAAVVASPTAPPARGAASTRQAMGAG